MRTSERQKERAYSHNSSRSVCSVCSSPLSPLASYVRGSHNNSAKVGVRQYSNNQLSSGSNSIKGPQAPTPTPTPTPARTPAPTPARTPAPAPTPTPSLPYGLDCSGRGDCSCSSLRHRLAHYSLKYGSPAPSGSPFARHVASPGASRAPGKDAAEAADVDWRIPYPGPTVFPSSPSASLEEKQEPADSGGGDAGSHARPARTPRKSLRLLALMAVLAALVAASSALLLAYGEWSREPVAVPPSRQLPAPEDANADARLALRPDAPLALEQLRAELRHVRTELQRVKERAAETTAVLSARWERRLAEAEAAAGVGGDAMMADFALESAGGSIVATPGTSAYSTGAWETLWGVPLWPVEKSPRNVIQPSLEPGACWAFRGDEGRVVVALALPARLTAVTLEHIPATATLTGQRDSAPRDFAVTGLQKTLDISGPVLGQFSYTLDGPPRQTFTFSSPSDYPFRAVLLHIRNNHGNTEYTCVYRFRVHGDAITGQTTKTAGLKNNARA